KAMRIFKRNLGIVNGRYSDLERRLFAMVAEVNQRSFILHDSVELLVSNAVKDGLLQRGDPVGLQNVGVGGMNSYRYEVTELAGIPCDAADLPEMAWDCSILRDSSDAF